MKNFKEFREDFKDELFSSGTADLFAYAAYCQGYAEAKSEDGKGNYLPLVLNELAKKYTQEELEELRKAAKGLNEYLAEHTGK